MKEVQFMEEEGRNGPSNTPRSVNSRSTSLHNNHNQLAREEPTQSNKFIKKKKNNKRIRSYQLNRQQQSEHASAT